jgi:hypothetical protein
MMYLRGADCERLLAGAVEQTLPALDSIVAETVVGWAGPAHLLDRDFSKAERGHRVRLNLVRAERKFPAARMKAEIKREIELWMAAEHREYCNRSKCAELKQQVMERLIPEAPVALTGMESVFDWMSGVVYTSAMSDAAADVLYLNTARACPGAKLADLSADEAALVEHSVQVRDLKPMKSGTGGQQEMFDFQTAREFLTWLWMLSESPAGQDFDLPDGGSMAVMLEGPLVLAHPVDSDSPINRVTVKGDRATMGDESLRALEDGKLLKQAKVTFAVNDLVWTFTVDADGWLFKGMKLPKGESLDAASRFDERMGYLDDFRRMWLGAFKVFLDMRTLKAAELDDAVEKWQLQKILTADSRLKRKHNRLMKALDRQASLPQKAQKGPKTVADRAVKAFGGSLEKGGSVSISTGGKEVFRVEKNAEGKVVASVPAEDAELYAQAIEIIKATKRASTSGLQRRLKIGYNRAAGLMDLLELRGVVGPATDAGPREILNLDAA